MRLDNLSGFVDLDRLIDLDRIIDLGGLTLKGLEDRGGYDIGVVYWRGGSRDNRTGLNTTSVGTRARGSGAVKVAQILDLSSDGKWNGSLVNTITV